MRIEKHGISEICQFTVNKLKYNIEENWSYIENENIMNPYKCKIVLVIY